MGALIRVPLSDEELLRRPVPQVPQATDVAPGAPPTPPAASVLPRVPVGAASMPAAPSPATTEPTSPAPASPTLAKARVPGAMEQRYQDLQTHGSGISNIHNKTGRVFARIGDAILGTFAPRAEMLIPGTEGNYGLQLTRARNAMEGEREEQEAGARTGLQRAQTHEAEARASSLENPASKTATNEMERFFQQNPTATVADWRQYQIDHPEKTQKEGGTVHEDADGNYWVIHPDGSATAVTAKGEQIKGKTAEEKGGTVHEDAQGNMWVVKPDGTATPVVPKTGETTPGAPAPTQLKGKTAAGSPEQQFIDEYRQKHPGSSIADAEKAFKAIQPPERPPHAIMFVPGTNGQMTATEIHPGSSIPSGAVTPTQAGSLNTPTTQMRNVSAQAQLVHEQTPHMLSELDRLKSKLGPMQGRWNEFMQGKVGMNDPDFAGLRADLLMYSSAVALMHARGRLPENLREEFDKTINNPGQDFANLKAVISRIDDWTSKNMQTMGGTNTGATDVLPGGISLKDIDAEIQRRKGQKK